MLRKFEARFGKSLSDLIDLFDDSCWKNPGSVGGPAWARIGRCVEELSEALSGEDLQHATSIASNLCDAQHNTGSLSEKLRNLDRNLPRA